MTNKQAEIKRILIFVFFAYALMWIPVIIMNKTVGYDTYMTTNRYALFNVYIMLAPSIANVLTRIVTKEGWKESYLRLHLRKNLKPYLFAVFAPAVCTAVGGIFLSIFFGKLDFGASFDNISPMLMLGISLTFISTALPGTFAAFGEEFGWRAYLYPKLEKLLGTPAAMIIGGVIWGVWHAPLTTQGHNFGTDYPGFPWLGILIMCAFSTLVGAILMWLTKRTGSVYPAAIAHTVLNGTSALTGLFANGYPEDINAFQIFIPTMIPMFVLGIIMFVILCRKKTPTENIPA